MHLALYIGVCKADKICLKLGQPPTYFLGNLRETYIIIVIVSAGFRYLRDSKNPSKYLTVLNYRLFSKVEINSLIHFGSSSLFSKLLHQVQFTSFSVDYAM